MKKEDLNLKIWDNYEQFSKKYHKFLRMPVKKMSLYPEKIELNKWASMASIYDNEKNMVKNK